MHSGWEMTGFLIAFCLILISAFALGAEKKASSEGSESGATTTVGASVTSEANLPASALSAYKLKAALKATNTSARLNDFDSPNGRRLKQKYEYVLGFAHASGWGLSGQAVTSGTSYGDEKKNSMGAGDPSLTLIHPTLYKSSDFQLSGQFRRYFAVTDRSKDRGQAQYAYYLYANRNLPGRWVIWNQATPRYFAQTYFQRFDTKYLFEDLTTLTKTQNTWFAYGVAQFTQFEWHENEAMGSAIDGSVFAKFTPVSNFSIEPRFILPLHVQNTVYDSATSVSLKNFKAELYAQLSY